MEEKSKKDKGDKGDKLCPWCSSEVNMVHFSEGVFVPLCPPDKCVKGVVVFIEVDTEEEAWAKWNQLI